MSFLPPPRRVRNNESPGPTAVLRERLYQRLLQLVDEHGAVLTGLAGADGRQAALIEPLHELARLQQLGAELVLDILPRIMRRLSFRAPGRRRRETLPARGRIDWPRTVQEQQRNPQREHELTVLTQTRQRDFAVGENLTSTAIVLDVRQRAEALLQQPLLQGAAAVLRRPIEQISAGCAQFLTAESRRLAAVLPAAEALRRSGRLAEHALELAQQRHANRAYHDLAEWYRRFSDLHLLSRPEPAGGRGLLLDQRRLDVDYRRWLLLELYRTLPAVGDALRISRDETGGLLVSGDGLVMRGSICADEGEALLRWERLEPAPHEVRSGTTLFWREPPLYWHVGWRAERSSLAAAHMAAADAEAVRGVIICCAEVDTALEGEAIVECVPPPQEVARLMPRLHALLHETLARLAPGPAPACAGAVLDGDGPALHRDRFGEPIRADDAVLCAKPYISERHIEIVSRSRHCCRDGRLCQIIGRPDALPPLRRPRSEHELLDELAQLRLSGSPPADDATAADSDGTLDAAVERISSAVVDMTRRFAEMSGAIGRLQRYEQQLLDMGLDRVYGQLGQGDRQSLCLALYLRDQLDAAESSDFSAVVLHLTRVLEEQLNPRLKQLVQIAPELFSRRHRIGIGNLHMIAREAARRARFHEVVSGSWRRLPDAGDTTHQLNLVIDLCEQVRPIRNAAAHTTPVSRPLLRSLMHAVCGSGDGRIGALHLLVSGWQR